MPADPQYNEYYTMVLDKIVTRYFKKLEAEIEEEERQASTSTVQFYFLDFLNRYAKVL